MAYADLKRGSGKQNMGGLLTKAWGMPIDDLDLTVPPTLSEVGKLLVSENLVPKATKGFIEVYMTIDKNKIDDTLVGEIDGHSKEILLEFFRPGAEQAVDEFEAMVMNDRFVWIVPDKDGNKRLVGICRLNPATTELCFELPAYLTGGTGTTGVASADLKGKTFQFTAKAPHAPLYYTGTIPLLGAGGGV